MRVDLLKHNQEAYEKVQKAISEGKKKIAVSHATGTGKSHLIAKLFEDYSNDNKLVLVPSTYISDQIQKLFEKYGIQNADIMLYQKLIKMPDEDIAAMDYSVIVLDEYHHNASTKVWGSKVKTLIEMHPESIVFGTSATPIKTGGVNAIDELFEGNCVSDLPLSESIARKIVPLPKYVGALYTLDDELEKLRKKVENATNTKEEKQEFYKKINTMRSQIEKSYGMPIILNKNIKDKEGKYIVFCKNKKHLAEIKDTVIGWFRTAGCKNINAYVVHSSYENKDAEYKAFCENASHNLHLLFCVDMLNEGLHLENISGVLLLRPTRSMIVFLQQIGRAIEANNTNTPVIIDAVNNFSSVGQGMELLREIKDAVAKEKESNSNFDDSELEDIDTFFVLEQVVEIQEMFKEIEERLEDDWNVMFQEYCKFYEENGHGDVPKTEEYRKLSNWCKHQRQDLDNGILKEERNKLLNDNGFVWDVPKYRFEKQIIETRDFIVKNGRYPKSNAENKFEKRLGNFVIHERYEKNNEDRVYPQWKIDFIRRQSELYDFFKEKKSRFEEFYKYALLYKEKFGHVNIKIPDNISGYKIGNIYFQLMNDYKNRKLTKEQINKLKDIGVDVTKKLFDKRYEYKLQLAKQAVNDGIIISRTNQEYKGINFYNWIAQTIKRKCDNGKMSSEEIEIVEKLIDNPLYKMCDHNVNFIKVIDKLKNTEIGIYFSSQKTIKDIQERFGLKICNKTIYNRLSGKVTTPYKGRFMFYYATDEEVKKYLEENKASQL